MSTANAFALLSTDASDSKVETVKKDAPKKAKKPAAAPAPAPAKKDKATKAKPAEEVRGSKVPSSAVEQKRGGKPTGKPSGKTTTSHKLSIQRSSGNRPPKREFDRHDGTGRAHEGMKRNGAGRGNWGKVTDHEAPEAEKPEQEEEEKETKEEKEPEMTEEEKARAKQRTLDQYQKQQKGVKTILRSAAAVEVECSADEKNYVPLARVDLVAEQEKAIAAEKAPKKAAAKPEKVEKAKKPKKEEVKLDIQFNDGRREHREKAAKPTKLSTSDEKAFPSLA